MKILKSITWVGTICIIVASLFGFQKGFAMLLLCIGFREAICAKDYYDNKQNSWAIVSLIVGILVILCGFFSLTNII